NSWAILPTRAGAEGMYAREDSKQRCQTSARCADDTRRDSLSYRLGLHHWTSVLVNVARLCTGAPTGGLSYCVRPLPRARYHKDPSQVGSNQMNKQEITRDETCGSSRLGHICRRGPNDESGRIEPCKSHDAMDGWSPPVAWSATVCSGHGGDPGSGPG